MPRVRMPRRGSLAVWPRKRAASQTPRIRSWAKTKDVVMLCFPGFKAGMTQATVLDNGPNSMTKGQEIIIPSTVIECPPISVFGATFYKNTPYGLKTFTTTLSPQFNKKTLSRSISVPKKHKKIEEVNLEEFDNLRLLIHTNPIHTGTGKKKPEIMEIEIGGTDKKAKLDYAKQVMGKEISVGEVIKTGELVDAHAVTKGKGIQGPVKRFGVAIRHHKSEKTKRGPGSLGPWHGPQTWRVAHAGQMGYHQRTDYNKRVLGIETDTNKVNPSGGFLRYGIVRNNYLIIKGSLPGPKKRTVILVKAIRPNDEKEQFTLKRLSLRSQQL